MCLFYKNLKVKINKKIINKEDRLKILLNDFEQL